MGAYFLGHCVYWGWQLHRRAPKRRRRKRGGKTASGHRGRRGPTALWRVVAVSAHAIVTVTLLVVMGNVRQCQLALTATDHLATLSSAPKALTIHTLICISQNSTCYVTSRHDTLSSPCILAQWLAVSLFSGSTARHARHDERDWRDLQDTCSGASPQRGLKWTCPAHFFQKLFLRSMQIQITRPNFYTRALLLLCRRHVGTSMARHARQARHARDDTSHHDTHVSCRDVPWRDAPSRIRAILLCIILCCSAPPVFLSHFPVLRFHPVFTPAFSEIL